MRKVIILGNGGHSLCVQEALLANGYKTEELGLVDPEEGDSPLGIRRIGGDDDLPGLACAGWKQAVVGVGSVNNTRLRHRLAEKIAEAGIELISIIDPEAKISRFSNVMSGAYIAKGSLVQPGCTIREMAIINTGAVVEHNCIIGPYSHISSGAVLLGNVSVEADTLIGASSVVRQGVKIGSRCIIGAGSVVVKDLPDHVIAYGNPCRIRGETDDTDYC